MEKLSFIEKYLLSLRMDGLNINKSYEKLPSAKI